MIILGSKGFLFICIYVYTMYYSICILLLYTRESRRTPGVTSIILHRQAPRHDLTCSVRSGSVPISASRLMVAKAPALPRPWQLKQPQVSHKKIPGFRKRGGNTFNAPGTGVGATSAAFNFCEALFLALKTLDC